jgi:DNA processing protein
MTSERDALITLSVLGPTRTLSIKKLAQQLFGGSYEALLHALKAQKLQENSANLQAWWHNACYHHPKNHDFEAQFKAKGVHCLTVLDKNYPEALKQIHHPPLTLYHKGNAKILTSHLKMLGVVGTRKASSYACHATRTLLEKLTSQPVCIVSGLAAGIDTEAHQAALDFNLPTIAVFGCGIDTIYPKSNTTLAQNILDRGGVWLSEYPPGFPGSKYTYPARNRIIAGLSEAVLVAEAGFASGAMITARDAMEENRTVLAIPGSIFESGTTGTHHLIRAGAQLISHGHQLLEELGLEKPSPKTLANSATKSGNLQQKLALTPSKHVPDLADPMQKKLLACIPFEPLSVEKLHQAFQNTYPGENIVTQLAEQLTYLELDGWIEILPGHQLKRIQ